SWYREPGRARVWCTGLGHTKEGYSGPPFRRHLLGGIQWAAGLAASGAEAGAVTPAPNAATGARIPRSRIEAMARFARQHPGDPGGGRTVYFESRDAGCARCHRARGQGGDIGPDLSDIGGKYELDLLIESVLDPSRQIAPGYRSEVVATGDGRVFSGLIRAESDRELNVVDVQGRRLVVAKADIQNRRPCSNSLIPDGLVSGLSPSDFSDLIAYLQSLRAAGTATPGSGLVGPVRLPPGFACDRIASGITGATAMTVAPDGRVFVCEQTGRLRVLKEGALQPEPFVRLDVDSTWERGLIGFTLDPDFGHNGYVYV